MVIGAVLSLVAKAVVLDEIVKTSGQAVSVILRGQVALSRRQLTIDGLI